MNHPFPYLSKLVLPAACLALLLGAGCGDSGSSTPQVSSALLGIYTVDSLLGNDTACENPTEVPSLGPRLVLYSFIPDGDDEPMLGGAFCQTVDSCQAIGRSGEGPGLGYSFLEGSDASGWRGWGIESGRPSGDQCSADVQAHVLTSPGTGSIEIETKTFTTVFEPEIDGSTAVCSNRQAVLSLNDDPPCSEILVLDGSFEAGL